MKTKKIMALGLALTMIFTMAGCGSKVDTTPIVKVGETEITRDQFDEYIALNAYLAGYDMEEINKQEAVKSQIEKLMLEQLISEELAKQYVSNKNKDALGATYEEDLKSFMESVHESVGEDLKKKGISDDTLTYFYNSQAYGQALYNEVKDGIEDLQGKKQAYYNEHLQAFTTSDLTLEASHILVEKEDEAKAIKAQLDNGADFATLAKEKSTDPGSGAKGGALGSFKEGEMVGEFWEGAKALSVGEISEPIKSQFGYHIIRLTNRQEAGVVSPYTEVETQVEEAVVSGVYQQKLDEIRTEIGVEYLDKSFVSEDKSADKKTDAKDESAQ